MSLAQQVPVAAVIGGVSAAFANPCDVILVSTHARRAHSIAAWLWPMVVMRDATYNDWCKKQYIQPGGAGWHPG